MIWKSLFSALGIGSLLYILHGYGFPRLAHDLSGLGFWLIPLSLSFLPVLFCYALAWQLITPGWKSFSKMLSFSIVSVAWNNLSPFVKILGEPVRLLMLGKYIARGEAVRSMVLYNIVHILGTLLSFFLGSLILLFCFPVSAGIRAGLFALVVVSPVLAGALYFLPLVSKALHWRPAKKGRFYRASLGFRWSLHKVRLFTHLYPGRFWLAVVVEIAARFIEGVTFFVAFRALGTFVPLATCALLDVGRAILDNIFFFVPYQVGTREGGILLLATDGVRIVSDQVVGAAILYRLVEIFWTAVGYLLWINESKSPKLVR